MIGLGKETPFRMGTRKPQVRHHFFVRKAFESVHQRTGLGNSATKLPERPSFDDGEGMLNDGPGDKQVKQANRGKTGLQGILSSLDAAGGAAPARLQFQAQRRFHDARLLEVPGYVGDRRASWHAVYERLVTDAQRALHRTLLGMNQPEPGGSARQEKRKTREYDSPQETQPSRLSQHGLLGARRLPWRCPFNSSA